MSIFLEITQLDNGDVVLREAEDEAGMDGSQAPEQGEGAIILRRASSEPLVRIRFSPEVNDMLGGDAVGVAEAMIDAATEYLGGIGELLDDGEDADDAQASEAVSPVIH